MFGQVFKFRFADISLQGIRTCSCVFLDFWPCSRYFLLRFCKQLSDSNDARGGFWLRVDLRLAVGCTFTLVVLRFCGLHFAASSSDSHCLWEGLFLCFPCFWGNGCIRISRLAGSVASDVQRYADASAAVVVLAKVSFLSQTGGDEGFCRGSCDCGGHQRS